MSENKAYTSNKVFKKAIFNIAFQCVPISVALILTPFLISEMSKDLWAKYSVGVSLIFLSNYFSFGIGPTLNRRVSELIGNNKYYKIVNEINECVSLSYLLGLIFLVFFQVILFFSYTSNSFSILRSFDDFCFFSIIIVNFFVVFCIVPYRSILESFSDFYFLAIVRAITASMLFVIPFVFTFYNISLIDISICLTIGYFVLYIAYFLRVRSLRGKYEFQLLHPFDSKIINNMFKLDNGFLRETYYFSLFFLTSAVVLFFDRFYYPIFFDTKIISDQVTMLDLFNRVAIVTGTISLVYFSAISVWYNEKNLGKIKSNLRLQVCMVTFIFLLIMVISYLYLNNILDWWLGSSYSLYINKNSFPLLFGALLINFTILLIRPLQAIGSIKTVSLLLVSSTIIYICIVVCLGIFEKIENHYLALITKALIDIIALIILSKRKNIL